MHEIKNTEAHTCFIVVDLTVKPTISMAGDVTPEMQQSDLDEDTNDAQQSPVGDILELTSRLKDSVPSSTAAALPMESAGKQRYTGKGKGVGKGCSGSSGPPLKKRQKTKKPPPPPPSSDSDSSNAADEEAEMQEVATQSIMVKSKRGYTTYPAYLFDVPPRKLRTDNLRKKLMIAEIKRSNSQRNFYDRISESDSEIEIFMHS